MAGVQPEARDTGNLRLEYSRRLETLGTYGRRTARGKRHRELTAADLHASLNYRSHLSLKTTVPPRINVSVKHSVLLESLQLNILWSVHNGHSSDEEFEQCTGVDMFGISKQEKL